MRERLLLSVGPILLGVTLATGALAQTPPTAAERPKAWGEPRHLFPETVPDRPNSPPIAIDQDFLLEADEVEYDQNTEIVTARGAVEISQNDRILRADAISYNRRNGIVTAAGHVALLEPTGDVVFGDYLQVTSDFKEAIVENFKALLADNSRLAGAGMERLPNGRKVITRGVFTPCAACADGDREPLWQIKGRRITHDEVKKDIIYEDATFEVFGVPILYTPYFSHPDPSVKRRSGFLSPKVGYSENYGVITGTPYYAVISDSADATIEPRLYSREGFMLAGEARKQFQSGKIRVAGSGLDEDFAGNYEDPATGRRWRGFFASEGRFDLDENWRAGWDVARTTDRAFLRQYKPGGDYGAKGRYQVSNILASDVFAEGFFGRSYVDVQAIAFQSLRDFDDPKKLAKIHPYGTADWVGNRDGIGGNFRVTANVLSLSREAGTDSSRISNLAGYYLPIVTSGGHMFDLAATLQLDGYSVNDVMQSDGTEYSGSVGRAHPRLSAYWHYPLIAPAIGGGSLIVEPIAGVVLSPIGNNPDKIPNEDSRTVELDASNIFSPNRFSGRDRVDNGSRFDYGAKFSFVGTEGRGISATVGQSQRLSTDSNAYPVGSGLEGKSSDLVGNFVVTPVSWLDLAYRVRIDQATYRTEREELSATVTHGLSGFSLSYINYERAFPEAGVVRPRSIEGAGVAQVTDNWGVYGQMAYDLKDGNTTEYAAGLLYRDECFGMLIAYSADYIDPRLGRDQTIFVKLWLKYLGDFGG
ncbi:LPS-assembly protein LptD [Lacibacterium aquatile]|uniref:LPS-assembly protein LptD n=1 Tax=Lacibacterium aquatile TaxID=1168082 RepID=A0ABW5DN19_9PROT